MNRGLMRKNLILYYVVKTLTLNKEDKDIAVFVSKGEYVMEDIYPYIIKKE